MVLNALLQVLNNVLDLDAKLVACVEGQRFVDRQSVRVVVLGCCYPVAVICRIAYVLGVVV